MWCSPREAREGCVSVLAQHAVSEGPPLGNDASWRVEGWVGEMVPQESLVYLCVRF
jgi:hypothetical protein